MIDGFSQLVSHFKSHPIETILSVVVGGVIVGMKDVYNRLTKTEDRVRQIEMAYVTREELQRSVDKGNESVKNINDRITDIYVILLNKHKETTDD